MTITTLSVRTPSAVKVMDLHVICLHLQMILIKKDVFGSAQTTMNVRKALAALNVIHSIPHRVFVGSRARTIPTVEVTVFALLKVNGLRNFVIHVFHWGDPVFFRTGAAQGLAAPLAFALKTTALVTITALSVRTPSAVKMMDIHVIHLHLHLFLIKKNVFGSAQTTMNVRKALAALNVIYPFPHRVFVGSRARTIPTVEVTVFALLKVN